MYRKSRGENEQHLSVGEFSKANYCNHRDLSDTPWPVGDIFGNSSEKYDYQMALFESIVDKHTPIRKKLNSEREGCSIYNS